MSHISGHDRSQRLLLPESLDEYVGPDNPVRFIDAFVDGLDLAAAARIFPVSSSGGAVFRRIAPARHVHAAGHRTSPLSSLHGGRAGAGPEEPRSGSHPESRWRPRP